MDLVISVSNAPRSASIQPTCQRPYWSTLRYIQTFWPGPTVATSPAAAYAVHGSCLRGHPRDRGREPFSAKEAWTKENLRRRRGWRRAATKSSQAGAGPLRSCSRASHTAFLLSVHSVLRRFLIITFRLSTSTSPSITFFIVTIKKMSRFKKELC